MSYQEENKELVKKFFDAFNNMDYFQIETLLDQDLKWFIIGKTKTSGIHNKREMLTGFKLIHRAFNNFHFSLYDITAEDDRISIIAESKGLHRSGKIYNNQYHFLFKISENKIIEVKEYFDTQLAAWIEED